MVGVIIVFIVSFVNKIKNLLSRSSGHGPTAVFIFFVRPQRKRSKRNSLFIFVTEFLGFVRNDNRFDNHFSVDGKERLTAPTSKKNARMGKTVFRWVQGKHLQTISIQYDLHQTFVLRQLNSMKKCRHHSARVSLRAGALPVSVPTK
jgi:hypothetical protein